MSGAGELKHGYFFEVVAVAATPSVLKYKLFWYFIRFIEYFLNLDKLYVQIH